MPGFGTFLRERRERLNAVHSGYSIRCLAKRLGIHHSYLSKIERGERAPLADRRIFALARELGVDHDLLLAMTGKLSEEITYLLAQYPEIFMSFISDLKKQNGNIESNAITIRKILHTDAELREMVRRLQDEITMCNQHKHRSEQSYIKYKLIFDLLPEASILANLETGIIVDVNTAAETLWKKSRDELVGLNQRLLHPSNGNEERVAKFKAHGSSDLAGDVHTEIINKCGEIIPVIINASRVVIEDEPCVLGIFKRVTGGLRLHYANDV